MPVIVINKIAERTKTSAKGKKYKVVTVEGTKYGSDEEWSTDIFKNKTDLLEQLEEFGPGDTANFKFVKNGDFYDLSEIVEPTEENLEYAASNPAPAKKSFAGKTDSGGAKSNGMTKEDWAEKDRLTNIRIAKAVALKAAVDNTKVDTKPAKLIEFAEVLIPWLLDTDGDSVTVDPEDALNPPTDD